MGIEVVFGCHVSYNVDIWVWWRKGPRNLPKCDVMTKSPSNFRCYTDLGVGDMVIKDYVTILVTWLFPALKAGGVHILRARMYEPMFCGALLHVRESVDTRPHVSTRGEKRLIPRCGAHAQRISWSRPARCLEGMWDSVTWPCSGFSNFEWNWSICLLGRMIIRHVVILTFYLPNCPSIYFYWPPWSW